MLNTHLLSNNDAQHALSIANLIYNPEAYQRLEYMAELLCSQSGMVPEHLREKKGDMMAIIMQATRWDLDPVMVAQSTFVINGTIGYEAKLIQSVAKSNGGISFTGEYYGNWENIVGNTRLTNVTKKGKFGNYQASVEVPNWTNSDEHGVGYVIKGHFPDDTIIELDVPLVTCKPRHSTNWTFNPKQQIHYTGVKRWVRQFTPHLAIGVKDYDDLYAANEKEVNAKPSTSRLKTQSHFFKLSKSDELFQLIRNINTEQDALDVEQYINEAMEFDEIKSDERDKLQKTLNVRRKSLMLS